jgi:HEAT repeat protein
MPSAKLVTTPSADAALLEALKDPERIVREEAVHAISSMELSHADHVLPALRLAMQDPDSYVRLTAIQALEKMGPSGIPLLIDALKDKEMVVRWWAAHTLARFGRDAQVALPALQELLRDEAEMVREAAQHALADIQAAGATR